MTHVTLSIGEHCCEVKFELLGNEVRGMSDTPVLFFSLFLLFPKKNCLLMYSTSEYKCSCNFP